MEYVIGSYLIIGAVYDGLKKRIPNRLSIVALFALGLWLISEVLFTGKVSGKEMVVRLVSGIGIYLLFYVFFCIGAFGGGDGKAAAVITVGIGLDAFFQVFLLSACFAITYGLFKLREKGYKRFFNRILTFFKLVGRGSWMTPAVLKAEMEEGLQIPFIPFILVGFLFYKIMSESGMLG